MLGWAALCNSLYEDTGAAGVTRMKSLTALILSFAVCGSAWAQTKQELASDLARLRDGKYVFEDYTLCRLDFQRLLTAMAISRGQPVPAQLSALPNVSYQLHVRAEAAADGSISRDSFVAMVGYFSALLQVKQAKVLFEQPGISMDQALQALVCKTLPQPIGTPDVRVNLYMTPDGMQVETVNTATQQTDRRTVEWAH